ncbi:hypothetical protein FKM82_014560 [Ascaphus truei]
MLLAIRQHSTTVTNSLVQVTASPYSMCSPGQCNRACTLSVPPPCKVPQVRPWNLHQGFLTFWRVPVRLHHQRRSPHPLCLGAKFVLWDSPYPWAK